MDGDLSSFVYQNMQQIDLISPKNMTQNRASNNYPRNIMSGKIQQDKHQLLKRKSSMELKEQEPTGTIISVASTKALENFKVSIQNQNINQSRKQVTLHSRQNYHNGNQQTPNLLDKIQTSGTLISTKNYQSQQQIDQNNYKTTMSSYQKQNNITKQGTNLFKIRPVTGNSTSNKLQQKALQNLQKFNKFVTLEGNLLSDETESNLINKEIKQIIRASSQSLIDEYYSPKRIQTTQGGQRDSSKKAFITQTGEDQNEGVVGDDFQAHVQQQQQICDWTQSLIFSNKTINEKVNKSPISYHKQGRTSHKNLQLKTLSVGVEHPFSHQSHAVENSTKRMQLDIITGQVLRIKSPKTRETSIRAMHAFGKQLQQKIEKQNQLIPDSTQGQQAAIQQRKLKFLQRFQDQSDKLKGTKIQRKMQQKQHNTDIQSDLPISDFNQQGKISPGNQKFYQTLQTNKKIGTQNQNDDLNYYAIGQKRLPSGMKLRQRKNYTSALQFSEEQLHNEYFVYFCLQFISRKSDQPETITIKTIKLGV
eukprot:403341730